MMLDGEDLAPRAALLAGSLATLGRTFDAEGLDDPGPRRWKRPPVHAGELATTRGCSGGAGRRFVHLRESSRGQGPARPPLIDRLADLDGTRHAARTSRPQRARHEGNWQPLPSSLTTRRPPGSVSCSITARRRGS